MSARAILAKPLCALAFCWRLERRDGIAIGLTSHDCDIVVDRFRYHPSPGMSPSAVEKDGSDEGEALEIAGALASGAISAADLEAGRWDGAALSVYLTEWTEPGALWLELARGRLGSVEHGGGQYRVTVSGALDQLDRPVAPETSPTCRAALGDAQCTVDLRPLTRVIAVEAVDGDAVTVRGLVPGGYPFGTLRWLEGPLAGLSHAVVAQDGDILMLTEAPAAAIVPGTRARIVEGCDRRLATCAARFGNVPNFRGEPFCRVWISSPAIREPDNG
jgi:uncharacterized phage protein (TIGR02218 family)